jgi:NADH dehydrogenase
LLEQLPLPKERQRLKVNAALAVEGYPGIWALGDCAITPDEHGGYQPPTAQHASREGKVLAHNIVAYNRGRDLMPFRFNMLGLLASIGRRRCCAYFWREFLRILRLVAMAHYLPA